MARLAGVGIQPRHHQPRVRFEPLAERQQLIQLALHKRRIQPPRHLGQGDMRGGEQGVQAPAAVWSSGGEEHRGLPHAAEFCKAFGLAGIAMACRLPAGLGDRRGHQGPAAALQHKLRGLGEPGEAGRSRRRLRLPRGDRLSERQIHHADPGRIGQGGAARHPQLPVLLLQPAAAAHQHHGRVQASTGKGLQHDFGADASGITQSHRQGTRIKE